jgi:CheY-like chemotaxis protein
LVLNFEAHFSAHPELASDPAVNDMRSSIDSLSNMLESILTISKLDANVLVPNVVMASVNDILERCYAANAASARQKNLDFRMIETDLFCETDPDMLFRAINNIVNNAVKYTKSGGILIGVRRRFGGHAIFVMDSGIGIPSDSLNSIYDEFTMLLDSSRKAGSGLGLSIVKKILRLLGMEIHTLSSVGVGSTFYIELPKTYAIPTARKNAQQLKRSAEDSSPPLAVTLEPKRMELKGPLVAVVDDVETLRSTICRVLQVHGIRTIDVSEWSELERLIEVEPPDLLITDYKLEHGVTGYDIILAARKKVSDKLPCFIITGDTSPALVSEMSARGVDIYYKPVKMGTLMDAVNTQLMKAC